MSLTQASNSLAEARMVASKAIALLATMRASASEFDACVKDIDNLIAGLDNEAH